MVKRSTKFYRKNEVEVMSQLGFKPTSNSGAGWIEKEDGLSEYLIGQLKSTDAESISIKLVDLHKLETNAIIAHKIPVFAIQFLQTNEVFVLAKPADLPSVARYLECGTCDIIQSDIVDIEEKNAAPSKVIRSGNRNQFWREKAKQWEKKKSK